MQTVILKWLGVALAVIAAVFLLVKAYEGWRSSVFAQGDRAGAARVQAQWDEQRTQMAAEAVKAAQVAARETKRRMERQQENQHAQDRQLAQARRDAAAAGAAADGLRVRAARYLEAAGCGSLAGDSALECVSAAARKVGDVLGQCAARHSELAAAADDARVRGLRCEADYGALTAP